MILHWNGHKSYISEHFNISQGNVHFVLFTNISQSSLSWSPHIVLKWFPHRWFRVNSYKQQIIIKKNKSDEHKWKCKTHHKCVCGAAECIQVSYKTKTKGQQETIIKKRRTQKKTTSKRLHTVKKSANIRRHLMPLLLWAPLLMCAQYGASVNSVTQAHYYTFYILGLLSFTQSTDSFNSAKNQPCFLLLSLFLF